MVEIIENVDIESKLAERVVKVMKDFDPYAFHDSFDSEDDAACTVLYDLMNGGLLTVELLCNFCDALMEEE